MIHAAIAQTRNCEQEWLPETLPETLQESHLTDLFHLTDPSIFLNHFCDSFCKNVVENIDELFKPSARKTGQEMHL
ncbi:MAG: hypothetical protein EHM14_08370 [Methanothrix sp.]|nr:MAG: hypothetical protein EHM14_08370 [Methanothrix sp.]